MNGKNNNIKYTAADIQKYLEGKLSVAEMHAIESAALNDEFLADAIEGIELYKTRGLGNFNADAEKIRNLIENKRKSKYGSVLWKAAAVIALIATVIALIFNQGGDFKKTGVLADKNIQSKKEEDVIIPSATLTDTVEEKKATDTEIIAKPSTPITKKSPSTIPASFEKGNRDSTHSIARLTEPKSARLYPKEFDAIQDREFETEVLEDKKQKTFSGVVKDENGNPVTGANILIKGTKNGTVTNEKGLFEIKDNSKDSTINVLVNSIGFNDTEKKIFLNNPSGNNIILDNSSSAGLDEAIITGYGGPSRKRKAAPDNDIVSENTNKARPATGWKDFKKYLQENKRTDLLQENIKGKVTVSFQFDEKGIPYDFSIERSLSPFNDLEAIRLIKEGPRWKLKNSKAAKLSINIDF